MNHEKYNRRSIRLKGYDYWQVGAYFITICTQNKECLFGKITDGKMVLNDAGNIIQEFNAITESHFKNIAISPFVVMPNHYHAIITVGAGSPRPNNPHNENDHICDDGRVRVDDGRVRVDDGRVRVDDGRGNPAPTLGQIVGYFKYQTTKRINTICQTGGKKLWQRNYYDHIIRDEKSFHAISTYIINNPAQWAKDELYL
uniref:Transposase IS200-like domain-containing protein n=1 Tax=Chlorobium chlorochromatii (strain CaD3) TaxID=340177 RepID=Q3AQE3_CHLCH